MAPPDPAPLTGQLLVDVAGMLAAASPVLAAAEVMKRLSIDVGGVLRSADVPKATDFGEKVESFRTKWEDEFEIVGRMFQAFGESIQEVARTMGIVDGLIGDHTNDLSKLLLGGG